MTHAEKGPQGDRSFFQRFKWAILCGAGLIIPGGIALLIVLLVVVPRDSAGPHGTNSGDQVYNMQPRDAKGLIAQPDLTKTDWKKNFGPFDDSSRPNDYAPPLDQPFPYNEKKIRGVNLGGWLVPEPFIVPSMYKPYDETADVKDEWALCHHLGKRACTERLTKHYSTWVTEEDIKTLAKAGLNHVRIPLGYWALENHDDEPFVYGAWEYLLRGIQWCRKHGLRVMIDFHAAPGSQNGWNHSGRLGQVRFLNATEPTSPENVERFLDIVERVVQFFDQPEWRNVVTQFGLVNEPAIHLTKEQDLVLDFYKTAFQRLRKTSQSHPLIVVHDGFLGPSQWEYKFSSGGGKSSDEFSGLVFDVHNYIIFDQRLIVKPPDEINDYPCQVWTTQMAQATKRVAPTMCGEFSLASNDCGPWLNGIKLGARYDGTYETDTPACPTCTCHDQDDYTKFTPEHKQFLNRFAEKQMDAFERGIGWYFWNFKTEHHVNPHWDYLIGLKEGWLPQDAGKRTNACPATPPSPPS